MAHQEAIESALRETAEDGGTWEAGREIFWAELMKNTPIRQALDRALRRTTGDPEKITKAKRAFWDILGPSIYHSRGGR